MNSEQKVTNENQSKDFDEDLIRKYPKANKKITVDIHEYGLKLGIEPDIKGQTQYISPYGLQFQGTKSFDEGTLLKIHVSIPDYWSRKQQFVKYQRVDTPETFRILAKVVKSEDLGKRGKKKMVTAQVVNMDEVDEQVLKSYLQDG